MGTTCAPLVADLRLFCYEGDLMLSLSVNNQVGVIEAFNLMAVLAFFVITMRLI